MKIEIVNSVVGIEYEVKEAGSTNVVDSNKGSGKPLEFITGMGHIIPGLEKGLEGMSAGDSGDIFVPAADAYGEYNADAVKTLPIEQFEGIDLKEGLTLYGQDEHGHTVQVTVKSFSDSDVTIDYNHPLAGKDLMFSVTIVSARAATDDEINSGIVGGHHQHGGGCCGGGHCGS